MSSIAQQPTGSRVQLSHRGGAAAAHPCDGYSIAGATQAANKAGSCGLFVFGMLHSRGLEVGAVIKGPCPGAAAHCAGACMLFAGPETGGNSLPGFDAHFLYVDAAERRSVVNLSWHLQQRS